MKNVYKRMLSLVLAIVMIVGQLPTAGYADFITDLYNALVGYNNTDTSESDEANGVSEPVNAPPVMMLGATAGTPIELTLYSDNKKTDTISSVYTRDNKTVTISTDDSNIVTVSKSVSSSSTSTSATITFEARKVGTTTVTVTYYTGNKNTQATKTYTVTVSLPEESSGNTTVKKETKKVYETWTDTVRSDSNNSHKPSITSSDTNIATASYTNNNNVTITAAVITMKIVQKMKMALIL